MDDDTTARCVLGAGWVGLRGSCWHVGRGGACCDAALGVCCACVPACVQRATRLPWLPHLAPLHDAACALSLPAHCRCRCLPARPRSDVAGAAGAEEVAAWRRALRHHMALVAHCGVPALSSGAQVGACAHGRACVCACPALLWQRTRLAWQRTLLAWLANMCTDAPPGPPGLAGLPACIRTVRACRRARHEPAGRLRLVLGACQCHRQCGAVQCSAVHDAGAVLNQHC